jgi:hypothetical protein
MSFGISIGDFITVTTLAWDTYSALRDASEDFQGFASEVHSLYTALVCLRDEGRSPSSILQYAAPQKIAGLKDVIENCEHSLIGLQKRAKKVCLLQPKQKRQFWHEFKLAFKDKQGPRDRIAIHTASINMFLSSLTHGSLGRLELLLRNALQSSSSGFSTSSTVRGLGNYTENAWNDIGQDLLMEGISEKHFGTFQNEIKAYMRYLVHGGAPLSETNFRHGSAAMPRSYRESLCDSSDDEYPPIAVVTHRRHGSPTGHRRHEDRIYVAGDLLSASSEVGGRHRRSSSTGAAPQPQFVNVAVGDRSPEREHSYDRRRGRSSSSASSEEEARYREHHRRASKRKSEVDADLILKLDKLKYLEEQERDREHAEDLKEMEIQKAKELYEREHKEKQEKKKKEKEKEKREKAEEDNKFEQRFKIQLMQAGYTEAQAEAVLQKKEENEKKHKNSNLSRPTWIKVKRKWLLPETLDHYHLPWEWDVS